MLKLGWFSTGRGEGSRGFLELVQGQIASEKLDARIEFVFTNREHGEAEGSDRFQAMVRGYGIPLVSLSSQRYQREHGGGPWAQHRDGFHRRAMELLSGYQPDVCVLAGYMLITSGEMCRRYPMLNLHPALPGGPKGTWQQVIWQLIGERARESGVMVHVATEELDAGPVAGYCSFPIRGGGFDPLWKAAEGRPVSELQREGEEQPLFKRIRAEGLRRERPLLLAVLRALAGGELRMSAGQVVDANGRPARPRDMNDEVERLLAGD
jgi:folate-dependent phosphoribosylglycinamide formyltransferase PurN